MTWSAPIDRTMSTLSAADAGHLGAERLGELDREAAHPARGPDDHDLLAGLDPSGVTQRLEGGEAGDGNGRGLLEGEVGRLLCQLALGDRGVLGKGPLAPAEHLVTRLQPGHVGADGLDAPGHVEARNWVLWLAQPVPQAGHVGQALHRQPVALTDRSRMYPDQHGIVGDHRLIDVVELQGIGWAVAGVDDRLHQVLLSRRRGGGEELSGRHGPTAEGWSAPGLLKGPRWTPSNPILNSMRSTAVSGRAQPPPVPSRRPRQHGVVLSLRPGRPRRAMSAGPRPIGPSRVWPTIGPPLRRYGHDRQQTSTSDEA